jgi:hypothetical protein
VFKAANIAAPQTDQENRVAANGSLIPVPGRTSRQAWYQGGARFRSRFHRLGDVGEIAFFDRGPIDAKLMLGGFWSAYWAQRQHCLRSRAIDIFSLTPSISDPERLLARR